jgi:UDP-3-O-[3-hydroxymyristoyl] glucosamine N-acyltransferase
VKKVPSPFWPIQNTLLYIQHTIFSDTGHPHFSAGAGLSCTLIRVEDAYLAFATLLEAYTQAAFSRLQPIGICASVATVEDGFTSENFLLWEPTQKLAACRIYPQVYVGDRVVVGSGIACIGSEVYADAGLAHVAPCIRTVVGDGFRLCTGAGRAIPKVPQIGMS